MSSKLNSPSSSPGKVSPKPPRVILAVDRPGWSFHQIASQIVHHCGNVFDFRIMPYSEIKNESADLLVCFWWRAMGQLLADNVFKRSLMCVYDHVTWSQTDGDAYEFKLSLDLASAVGVANQEIANQMRYRGFDQKPFFLIEDGVNTELFIHKPLPQIMTFGWAGNPSAGHGQIKGLELIKEACSETGHELKVLDATKKRLEHEQMPQWYSTISCYICASSMEGTPNPPLEAMACGRPVISTRVGILERIINDGINGMFVKRTVNELICAIRAMERRDIMKMSFAARFAAESHSWTYKIIPWFNTLRTLCVL